MTRAEAKALGLTRYFTGRSCKRGHVAERLVASHACVQCVTEYQRARYAATPEAQQARERRARRQAPKEAYRRYREAWWQANPEAVASVGERQGRARIVRRPLPYWRWCRIQFSEMSWSEKQAEIERMRAGTEIFRGELRDPDCAAFARRKAVAELYDCQPEPMGDNVVALRPLSLRRYVPSWRRRESHR